MKTDEDLKKIAHDIRAGLIYHDQCIPSGMRPELVFMALALMDEKTAKAFADSKPVLLYEYVSKAQQRSINGQPTFFSCRYLIQEELDKVVDYIEKIDKAMEAI